MYGMCDALVCSFCPLFYFNIVVTFKISVVFKSELSYNQGILVPITALSAHMMYLVDHHYHVINYTDIV